MSSSRETEPSGDARGVLGLARDFSPEDLEAAYRRLRAHIAARADTVEQPVFMAARRAELEELDRLVDRLRSPTPPPGAAPGRSRVGGTRRLWIAVGVLSAAVVALILALLLRPTSIPEDPEEIPVAPPEPAVLSARAEPIGAQLAILAAEDEHVVAEGAADGTRHRVEAGDYRLRVARADCPDVWTQDVQIGPGESLEFAPRICLGSGSLVVRSNVNGDRVRIDDLDVGSTGETPHPVSIGDHQITVEKRGFEPWTGTVRIHPDEVLTLRAELEPSAGSAADRLEASGGEPAGEVAPPEAEDVASAPEAVRPPPPGGAPEAAEQGPESLLKLGSAKRVVQKNPGGSKGWHDAVKERLLATYDSNGSRALDTPEELNAIPCSEWRAIEASYETGGLGIPMTRLYGFDGSDAPTNTLGVTRSMASYAYDRMKRCGLK
jgi:hypothetical protein